MRREPGPLLSPRRWPLALAAAVVASLSLGCKHPRRGPPAEPPGAVMPRAAASDLPDQLAPDVILETREVAFGLPLPEGMTITRELYDNVVVVGTRPLEDVVAYVSERVDADVKSEAGSTSFVHATVKHPKGEWRGSLRIDVERRGATTVISLWGEPRRAVARASEAADDATDPPPPAP